MTNTNTTTPQNYILYRTTAYMGQPEGYVIAAQKLTGTTVLKPPTGTAYVADPDGKYPAGSIYTPATDYTLTGASTATTTTATDSTTTASTNTATSTSIGDA